MGVLEKSCSTCLITKRSKFSYEMVFSRTEEEIKKIRVRIEKDKTQVPILMFLYRDGRED